MKLKMQSAGVPAGSYNAKFVGYEQDENQYGQCLRWEWEVQSGDKKGSKTGCLTALAPTSKNSCGRIIEGMLGKALAVGGEVDIDTFKGKTYIVNVKAGDNGGTHVDSVMLPPT